MLGLHSVFIEVRDDFACITHYVTSFYNAIQWQSNQNQEDEKKQICLQFVSYFFSLRYILRDEKQFYKYIRSSFTKYKLVLCHIFYEKLKLNYFFTQSDCAIQIE